MCEGLLALETPPSPKFQKKETVSEEEALPSKNTGSGSWPVEGLAEIAAVGVAAQSVEQQRIAKRRTAPNRERVIFRSWPLPEHLPYDLQQNFAGGLRAREGINDTILRWDYGRDRGVVAGTY